MYLSNLFSYIHQKIFIMSKSKKTAIAAGDNGVTEDIPYQEFHDPGPDITPVDAAIKTELVKFNFTDAAIAKLKDNYGGLTIKDESDKAGYELVKKAWNDVRTKRTGLEKKGLELRTGYTVITKAIKTEEVRLIDLLAPLEAELLAKWKKIDDDKERKKKEQEEAEGRRLMARIETLQECGMSFRDGFYQIGDTITADVATLRAMPDDTFEKLKAAVITKAAEIKRAKDIERERQHQEQLEQERQRQELKRQQDELAQQQREIQEQKAEMARQLRDMRLGKLQAIGLELSGDFLWFDGKKLYVEPLIEMTAAEFNRVLDEYAELIKEHKNKKAQAAEKEKQEQAVREKKEKYIASCLETAGMVYNWNLRAFTYKDDEKYTELTIKELAELSEGQIATKAQELADQLLIWKAEQAKRDEMKKLDEQRQQRLGLSDKQRWNREMEQLKGQVARIVPGEYKTASYKKNASAIVAQLTDIIKSFE